jgi:hypothetical protein
MLRMMYRTPSFSMEYLCLLSTRSSGRIHTSTTWAIHLSFQHRQIWLSNGTGHTMNHLCALARTTEDTFVLLAADACHHVGSLRPSEYLPLPDTISPSVWEKYSHMTQNSSCTCSCFKAILPESSMSKSSFYGIAPGMHEDPQNARDTVQKLKAFDAHDDVLVIITHDQSLIDVVDFFPKPLNQWKEKNWAELGRWRFLADFKDAITEESK